MSGPRTRRLRKRARWLVRRRRREWRRRDDPVCGRRRALREEVDYWADWIEARGGKFAGEFAYRFDPEAEVVDRALREVLAFTTDHVTILDVGAGPASMVGCRFQGRSLDVVAVDPLADKYNLLLEDAGLAPPIRTEPVEGEKLVEHFGRDRFDVAYSRNALDHTVDPVIVVEQMLAVTRPGGYLVFRHGRREAISESYVQLHQWNLDELDGDFLIWRPGTETNMTKALAARAHVRCWIEDEDGDTVVTVIRKHEPSA